MKENVITNMSAHKRAFLASGKLRDTTISLHDFDVFVNTIRQAETAARWKALEEAAQYLDDAAREIRALKHKDNKHD